ncbi:MAG: cytochrome c oxidase subunit 2 [Saprospiraceae bacterium]|jgi:cytochrome c oxidase subunit 2
MKNFGWSNKFLLIPLLVFLAYFPSDNEKWNGPMTIEVTADEYKWTFVYPGEDGQLNTADDIATEQEFRLPAHSEIILLLKSNDYLYTFSLSDFSAKEMVVPGLIRRLEFKTNHNGNYELKGDQMCGFTHESLFGNLKVQSVSHFKKWLISEREM